MSARLSLCENRADYTGSNPAILRISAVKPEN